jgi:hypothetical protein
MIIFLVEDYSMKKFFEGILPRLGFEKHQFDIKHHHGKEDLLMNLDKIVPSLCKSAQFIMVVIDQDKQNCTLLKNKIKTKMVRCVCEYKIRIACYELESWFLGDMQAISRCSPRFKASFFQNKEKYRDIDSISKPSDVIAEMIPDYEKQYSSKGKFAESISNEIFLDDQNLVHANRSHSFHTCLKTLQLIKMHL